MSGALERCAASVIVWARPVDPHGPTRDAAVVVFSDDRALVMSARHVTINRIMDIAGGRLGAHCVALRHSKADRSGDKSNRERGGENIFHNSFSFVFLRLG
jgi:hypothetical protein